CRCNTDKLYHDLLLRELSPDRIGAGSCAGRRQLTHGEGGLKLSETGSIVYRQAIDLGRRKLVGDCSDAPINVIAVITRGIGLQLQDDVFFALLGKNRGLNRTARTWSMT